ncbi:uncharacterized GPI-anchored protein At1g61900 [Cucurbita moschata]|uniref:Uncharacterized GPI-anchored protein At1g61900 n=1 Tax=Cucurbita moschata TaxID=3662 RepID=A0A6J1F438_CUCMO|nr:uncharacterized GPI-anchored protein At1g61900 [Cucurbita moschata]
MVDRFSLKLRFDAVLLHTLLLLLYFHETSCIPSTSPTRHLSNEKPMDDMYPEIAPSGNPKPFLPLLAPSPLAPFTNTTVPNLSGQCLLNFSATETLMGVTAMDCWAPFAKQMANVICCPQLEATLAILIGQSSKDTNVLALNGTLAEYCLSDIEQILVGQGANERLKHICRVHPANLTEGSCPAKDVSEFETTVDTSKLLAACNKIDPVKECCNAICQNAISEAATKLAMISTDFLGMPGSQVLPEQSARVRDCKTIVLRWLASKLHPANAKEVLRVLSNCNVNKVCPLEFPDMKYVADACGNAISNKTGCCLAMESYVTHLQKQSLVTNLQALDCATSLEMKLRKSNITKNVYDLCHISLKDFSLQVGNQEFGCLLPSLPSDAIFDPSSGISFVCDLNDHIPAPWSSSTQMTASSCNKTIKIPALPAAASAQSGLYNDGVVHVLLIAISVALMILI